MWRVAAASASTLPNERHGASLHAPGGAPTREGEPSRFANEALHHVTLLTVVHWQVRLGGRLLYWRYDTLVQWIRFPSPS